MAAKSPLLIGGPSVAAGGPAANRCSETASRIWFATISIIKLNCVAAYLLTRIMARIYMYSNLRRRGEEILQMVLE
jgi:hypothetical protein